MTSAASTPLHFRRPVILRSRTAEAIEIDHDPEALDEVLESVSAALDRGDSIDPDLVDRLVGLVDDARFANPEDRAVMMEDVAAIVKRWRAAGGSGNGGDRPE